MRRLLLFVALLCLSTVAQADPTNLGGGVLIAHYVADLALSEPTPEGVCAAYEPYALVNYADQVNRIDTSTYLIANWFVIAAWTEDKEFCGVQFGFGDYDPAVFSYSYFDACFPPTGGLTIPSAGWPGPNEGIAFVVTGDPWTGNYIPVYWFIGYAYGYGSPDLIQMVPDPTVAEPFGGMGNCASPPEKWDAELGGIGINMDGIYVGPLCCLPGACCFGTDCEILPEEECIALGGVYMGDESLCEPNPCDPPWACCAGSGCFMATAAECDALGGDWFEGEDCEPDPCPIVRVCCIGPEGWECVLATQEECEAQGGIFMPDWDTCEPNPCPGGSPTEDSSWGVIKGLYR